MNPKQKAHITKTGELLAQAGFELVEASDGYMPDQVKVALVRAQHHIIEAMNDLDLIQTYNGVPKGIERHGA